MRTLFLVALGAIGGIVFVIACSDPPGSIDAGVDAQAATCSTCEKPITAARYYRVRGRDTIRITPGKVFASANCNPSTDIIVGGGCTVFLSSESADYIDSGLTHVALFDSGIRPATPKGNLPDDDTSWLCAYDNPDNLPDLQVVATAICFHPEP